MDQTNCSFTSCHYRNQSFLGYFMYKDLLQLFESLTRRWQQYWHILGTFGAKKWKTILRMYTLNSANCWHQKCDKLFCPMWVRQTTSFALFECGRHILPYVSAADIFCPMWVRQTTYFAPCECGRQHILPYVSAADNIFCPMWVRQTTSFALCECSRQRLLPYVSAADNIFQ